MDTTLTDIALAETLEVLFQEGGQPDPAALRQQVETQKLALLQEWGLDPGDLATLRALAVGAMLSLNSARMAIFANQPERIYEMLRDRLIRTAELYAQCRTLEEDASSA